MAWISTTSAVADSSMAGNSETIGEWIQHHLQNSGEWHLPGLPIHLPHFEPFHLWGMTIDLSITNHTVMLWIAGILTVALFRLSYKKGERVPRGFGALMEMLVIFIRDEVAIANMGEKEGRRFTPLLVTFFFFRYIFYRINSIFYRH